jgi:drug/metabolite transporter (DMT)-like permease
MTPATPSPAQPDRGTLAAFGGVVLFGGINAIAVKHMVLEIAPFWSAAIPFAAAGLIMVAIALLMRRAFPDGRSLVGAVIYGALGFAASYGLLYFALQDVPAGTAMVLIAMTPLFTFGLAIAHRLERFRLQGMLGAVMAAAGIAIVFADQLGAAVPLGSLLLILLGTVAIAESGVIVKWIPKSDPFWTNAIAMLGGAALLLAVTTVAGEPWALPATAATWVALGHLVLLGSVAMFALYVFGLKRWTASAMSYVTLLMPLVTLALAAVLIGERITPLFAIGGAVILGGVYVGAFWTPRPARSTATATPECLPVQDCAEASVQPSPEPIPSEARQ